MDPLRPTDIMDRKSYEEARPDFRRRIMVRKARRRVPLGPEATLHFETRETMRYQVLEMLRAEGSWDRPGAVEAELEAYGPLIPAGAELTATLMLEYDDPAQRALRLRELRGLEKHLWLTVGDAPPTRASFDQAQVAEDRISSVQYLRWALNPEQVDLVKGGGTVLRVWVDHPAYRAQAVLSEETRAELAGDLA